MRLGARIEQGAGATPAEDEAKTAVARPRWWRRVGFWRSLAGMAAALALAVAIVLAETSATLVSRTRRYLHKIAQLNASVRQLKTRVNTAERRTTTALEHANADEVLKRVLTASDLRTIKLSGGAKGSDPASLA